uniref:ADP ribosylation factor like GTPase 10 n=1 Tax=Accipiter nisus TaxID=211598 RepID=A0A8B9N7D8_9AVES
MALPGALRDLTLALGAAVAAVGSLLFIAWKVYFRGTGTGTDWDGWWEQELRELRDRAPPGDTVRGWGGWTLLDWRQVLVLGLDGAGKSSVLHYICSQTARDHIAPTHGFNSAQLSVEGLEMDLLEVGGSQNLRAYWPHYLSQAHVLVFVVDSVDRSRLLTARQELHTLLATEPQLPLVVLANKQVGVHPRGTGSWKTDRGSRGAHQGKGVRPGWSPLLITLCCPPAPLAGKGPRARSPKLQAGRSLVGEGSRTWPHPQPLLPTGKSAKAQALPAPQRPPAPLLQKVTCA